MSSSRVGTNESTIEGYIAWLERRGRERSATVYARIARRYLEDPEAFERSIVRGSYAPNYRRFLAACLKSWAKFAKDDGLRERLSDLRLPAAVPQDVREPFERAEWVAIRREIETADYLTTAVRAVCSIIALRGIRCGDILRVRKDEIEAALKTGVLAFEGKGQRRQQYNAEPMRPYLKALLEERWPQGAKRACVRDVVCSTGKQDSASMAVRRGFDRVAEALELDGEEVYAHRFRHTYATYFLQEMHGDAEAIFKLQQQMGWARLETAGNYLRRSRRQELDDIESRLLGSRGASDE